MDIIEEIRQYADSRGMNPFILTRAEAKEIIHDYDELNTSYIEAAKGLEKEQKG